MNVFECVLMSILLIEVVLVTIGGILKVAGDFYDWCYELSNKLMIVSIYILIGDIIITLIYLVVQLIICIWTT